MLKSEPSIKRRRLMPLWIKLFAVLYLLVSMVTLFNLLQGHSGYPLLLLQVQAQAWWFVGLLFISAVWLGLASILLLFGHRFGVGAMQLAMIGGLFWSFYVMWDSFFHGLQLWRWEVIPQLLLFTQLRRMQPSWQALQATPAS